MVADTENVENLGVSPVFGRSSRYTFAKQWLRQQNYRVFRGDKEILISDRNELMHDIQPLDTKIPVGEDLVDKNRIKRIGRYRDLKREGYVIVARDLIVPWNNRRVGYIIVPQTLNCRDYGEIPPDHAVEYDVGNKRYRLLGPNSSPTGIGKWTRPKGGLVNNTEDTQRKRRLGLDYYKENAFKVLASARGFDIEDTVFKSIKEVPVMIAESKELVCLPDSKDEMVIGIVGERGQGKTFTLSSIASRIYWKTKKRVGFLNDPYNQTCSLAMPVQNEQFVEQLGKIGEHPLPMPMVWLYPVTNTFLDRNMFGREVGVGHSISFPFQQAVMDYTNFFAGKKEWKLDNSAPLLRLVADELSGCKTMDDMYKVVANAKITTDSSKTGFKIPDNSKGKVIKVLNDVYAQQILDISTGVPSTWKLINQQTHETREYSPFLAMMACNLVPALMTRNLQTKHYFPQYMKYLLDDIFNNQTRDEYFAKNKIVTYLVVDEITNIASTENKSVAQESLVQCVTEGRPNRIGFMYTTQNYSIIDRRIRENTTHLFSFRLKQETKHIRSDFRLSASDEDDMKQLQKFEMLAMTTGKFVIYDVNGNRRESEPGETFKGFAIPPVCEPSTPR